MAHCPNYLFSSQCQHSRSDKNQLYFVMLLLGYNTNHAKCSHMQIIVKTSSASYFVQVL